MPIKFTSPYGWDFHDDPAKLIKISSRGLIGNDRSDFIKRAGHSFIDAIDNIKVAEDEVPVHLLALGATERYGPNRNGDGFGEKACRERHSTFTKFAKFFRNHKNKPAQGHPHYGQVKLSAYNEDMGRVELFVTLNGSEKAAKRNGGLVADVELEKLANGEDLSVSMAAKVPFDSCSYCGNEAKTREDYCTAEKCAAGGCKDNLAKLVKVAGDLHHLHVDNPEPTWFDISRVFRPADRIAYGGRATYMDKQASDGDLLELQRDMTKQADHTAPIDVLLYSTGQQEAWTEEELSQLKLAYSLSQIEKQLPTSTADYLGLPTASPDLTKAASAVRNTPSLLRSLASYKIIVPLSTYADLTGRSHVYKEASQLLPRVYSLGLETESILPAIKRANQQLGWSLETSKGRQLAISLRDSLSLEKTAVVQRAAAQVIRKSESPRLASGALSTRTLPEAEKLAMDYAAYKLQSLYHIASFDDQFPLTATLSIRQNQLRDQ
jgi:hypothetical protein